MIKIVTIVGARPQFIKASVVSRAFKVNTQFEEIIIHTGQHFDENMSKVFFTEMDIPKPKYNLNVNNMTHGAMTGKMLEKIEKILLEEKPDIVMVYGDTNSTLAGALAAKKLNIKVAHIEAGLRSFNNLMPEEINRILTDRISDILFCPTEKSIENLIKEGFTNFDCEIVKCGDVMLDTALYYSNIERKPDFTIPNGFILATVHREDNTNNLEKLKSIFQALNSIAKKRPVVIPIHPRTKKSLADSRIQLEDSPVCFVDPVSYLEMNYLLKRCKLVMTDSGGLQKEAFFFKKLCVTIRDETEWTELVDHQFNIVSGTETKQIIRSYESMINRKVSFEIDLYGSGNAANEIASKILGYKL